MRIQFSPYYILTLVAASLFGCTGEPPQVNAVGTASATGNHPPTIRSAKIMPEPPVLTAPLSIQVDAEDPDRNAVSFGLKWFVNDKQVLRDDVHILPTDSLRRGDRVRVEVTPFDGAVHGTPYKTQTIVIGNTPPNITTVLLELTQDRIRARVDVSDADHDMIHLRYRWWKNKTLLQEGEESEIAVDRFGRQDVIRAEVIPSDQSQSGQAVFSDALTLGNNPPKFVSSPNIPSDGDRFLYAVQAKDVDGDPVSYSLETAPSGMTINEHTGLIAWQVPAGQHGPFHVKVLARDGQGGEAYQEFDLTLSEPVSTKPAGA